MAQDSFIFYRSYFESIALLPDNLQLELFYAICNLSLNDLDTNLEGTSLAIFKLIEPQIKANKARYNNGSKGGRPKKEKPKNNLDKTKKEPNKNENENNNNNKNKNKNENNNEQKKENTQLEIAFDDFIEMRKKIRKPVTDRAIELIKNDFAKWNYNESQQIQALNNSTVNSWQGVFKLKEGEIYDKFKAINGRSEAEERKKRYDDSEQSNFYK